MTLVFAYILRQNIHIDNLTHTHIYIYLIKRIYFEENKGKVLLN
jgi:hypothetical protein